MKLTQRRIEGLICPAGKKDKLAFDDDQKGLAVRVTASGGKTYLAQYSRAGKKRRVPLGTVDAISLAQARIAARAIMGDVAKGRDPATERKEKALAAKRKKAHDALTVGKLVGDWEALHLVNKRPRYAFEATRAIRSVFKEYLDWPAAGLTRDRIVDTLDQLTKGGSPIMASRAGVYLGSAYQWAIDRGKLHINPCARLPRVAPTERDRVLTDPELRAVWAATESEGAFNAIVRMLILTGQRREEVAAMTWGELSADFSTWKIPGSRTKNGLTHIVPLSRQAQGTLEAQPRLNDNPHVFPGPAGGAFKSFSSAKTALNRACGVEGWVLHDLRRTVATNLQKLGARLEVTEACLNHVSGSRAGIVGVYQRHHWADEKRTALTAWGEYVAAIVVEGREPASNVAAFRAGPATSHDNYRATYAGSLDEEQRRRIKDCLVKDGLSLASDDFETFIREIEASIADYLSIATDGSFRDNHDALRDLYKLSHDYDPPIGVLRARIGKLPRQAAEYINGRWPMVHSNLFPDEPEARQFQDWAQKADPEDLIEAIRVTSAEGAQIVDGRSRGSGKRSGRQAEPIIMGETRGAGGRTHQGGRRNSADEQELVMRLALDWLGATGKEPTQGRSDHRGFGDLVYCIFELIGLPDGGAAYALREYWTEVARGRKARGSRETA